MIVPLEADQTFEPCPTEEGDELFPNGIFEFNITKMQGYIRDNAGFFPVTEAVVNDFPRAFSRLDEAYVDSADITKPVILAEIAPNRFNVIDGHHRMEKARRLGVQTLPAYKLAMPQHIRFLVSRRGYEAYVGYWNGKIQPMCGKAGKNIIANLGAADDLRRKWPKADLLYSLGFPEAVRQNMCRRYWQEQECITLAEVFEIIISSKKDPRPGYLISKMLDCSCVGRVAFLKAVEHMTQLDLGNRCNLAWKRRYKKFKEAHRARGSREYSWSFPLTEAGTMMARFKNGAAYIPRRRKKRTP
jgi:hypothetical protein